MLLTSATLQIFEVLLQRFTPHTYGNLVLRNFPDGTFTQANSPGIIAAWEKVELWTQLVPSELRPLKSEDEEDDYHNYYLEAQKHAADCAAAKAKWCGSAGGLGQNINPNEENNNNHAAWFIS
ncbi:hypothetical protein SARC_02726 [Sphaeroforma arctica JP610]|uniref:Uncharacterized protein n=1 Tax=Sphaeroforma arctica JP610 TaxID=667725 RepID=A0A0L0G7W4_9EUKA|nr:hypothetical protein SARC_02726 [Sphaeroforma arctica JP610]KNC85065.1 hypothetical protein SARC_02726 [Sphaeroforma arctica JP610]|eukprot:XP_014158967.1 hypothetical protein SARC_02726 [Sphaeroforma arctica JP610]